MVELIDLHNHTTFSDGTFSPSYLKALADKMGIMLGISDHLDNERINSVKKFNEYMNVLKGLGVYKGVEIGLLGEVVIPIENLSELDYIIGGLHNLLINGKNFELWGNDVYEGSVDVFIDELVRSLVRCVEDYPIDILAHPTYVPPFISNTFDVQSIWTDDRMSYIIDACVENGVAIEISNRWRVPHEQFIRIALDKGAIFSTGSDGHSERWYLQLNYPLSIIKTLGIQEGRIFTPDNPFNRLKRFV